MIDSLICLLSLLPTDSVKILPQKEFIYIEIKTTEGISSGWFNVAKCNKKEENE